MTAYGRVVEGATMARPQPAFGDHQDLTAWIDIFQINQNDWIVIGTRDMQSHDCVARHLAVAIERLSAKRQHKVQQFTTVKVNNFSTQLRLRRPTVPFAGANGLLFVRQQLLL